MTSLSHTTSVDLAGRRKAVAKLICGFGATLGLGKVGGKWMVTHEHVSVPFDPQSGQASLDLKP
jgi:hypothetical protein